MINYILKRSKSDKLVHRWQEHQKAATNGAYFAHKEEIYVYNWTLIRGDCVRISYGFKIILDLTFKINMLLKI